MNIINLLAIILENVLNYLNMFKCIVLLIIKEELVTIIPPIKDPV